MKVECNFPAAVMMAANRVKEAGGRCLLVGGGVLAALDGDDPKDWDIEVYGLSYNKLQNIFSTEAPKLVGNQFGVIKLNIDGLELDISLPRRENKVGLGHKGFDIELVPDMDEEEAGRRRDFTINSMGINIHTKELSDWFGGLEDYRKGVLRATDPETFVEDPLRVLRGMQLLARKAKYIDLKTMQLMNSMAHTFPELAKERLCEEWDKLLMKSDKPSVGIDFLIDVGWMHWFPELNELEDCGQNPDWHPEGNVLIHTKHVADSAVWVRDNTTLDPFWKKALMYAALLHDVGKPDTTVTPSMVEQGLFPKERLWTAQGHDKAGEPLAETFMRRLTNNKKLIKAVVSIVGNHMQPFNLVKGKAKKSAYERLHRKVPLDVIGWMSKCDSCGRPDHMPGHQGRCIGDPDYEHKISQVLFSRYEDMMNEPAPQIINGKHLVGAGFKPGPGFKDALRAAHDAQLDNPSLSEDDLLKVATDQLLGNFTEL